MPIINLTDEQSTKRLPLLGDIRAGAPRGEDGRVGRNLETFRVSFRESLYPDDRQKLEDAFIAVYGSLYPERINIGIIDDKPDQCFPNWMDEQGTSGIARRCDGQQVQFEWIESEGYSNVKRPCERLCGRRCGCNESAYLWFILPEIAERSGVLGMFRYHTTSRNNIAGIFGALSLEYMKYRSLFGVSFIMYRSDETIQKLMNSKKQGMTRSRGKATLVRLTPNDRVNRQYMLSGGYAPNPVLGIEGAGNYDREEYEQHQLPADTDAFIDNGNDILPLSELPEAQDKLIGWAKERGLTAEDIRLAIGGDPSASTLTRFQAWDRLKDYLAWLNRQPPITPEVVE